MFSFTTLPGLFIESVDSMPREVALQYHHAGKWVSYSSSAVKSQVTHLALGLLEYGIARGDTVGIIAPSGPDWVMLDFAIQIAGALTISIFEQISPQNFAHEVRDSGMKLLFVGSEYKFAMAQEHGKKLKDIITFYYPGDHQNFNSLLKSGMRRHHKNPGEFEKQVCMVKSSDIATIIYTSGSTGLPKGVMLTQSNIVSQVYATAKRFHSDSQHDVVLSMLPLAHIFERMSICFYIASGLPISFVNDPKSLGTLIKEIKPTIFTVVPRVLEKVYFKMKSEVASYHGMKRMIAQAAIRCADTRDERQRKGILGAFYDMLVYKKMRDGLGGRARFVISGSAKLDPNIGRFFVNIGIPVYEGYGMTETSPVITGNYPGHRKLGTVGPPFPDVEVKIEGGEILAKGPNVMQGYHNNPEATANTLTEDGWIHTGDLGMIDEDGYVTITGRKKELFKKSTGEYVSPLPIEQKLSYIDGVDTAIIVADNRAYVTALLFPDMESLSQLKQRITQVHRSDEAFLTSKEMHEYLEHEIAIINETLNHAERVERFHLMDHAASIDRGELTSTLKIRRFIIEEMYQDIIEKMYEVINRGLEK